MDNEKIVADPTMNLPVATLLIVHQVGYHIAYISDVQEPKK